MRFDRQSNEPRNWLADQPMIDLVNLLRLIPLGKKCGKIAISGAANAF